MYSPPRAGLQGNTIAPTRGRCREPNYGSDRKDPVPKAGRKEHDGTLGDLKGSPGVNESGGRSSKAWLEQDSDLALRDTQDCAPKEDRGVLTAIWGKVAYPWSTV